MYKKTTKRTPQTIQKGISLLRWRRSAPTPDFRIPNERWHLQKWLRAGWLYGSEKWDKESKEYSQKLNGVWGVGFQCWVSWVGEAIEGDYSGGTNKSE